MPLMPIFEYIDLKSSREKMVAKVYQILKYHRMTKAAFSRKCGISYSLLYKLLKGEPLSVATLKKIKEGIERIEKRDL